MHTQVHAEQAFSHHSHAVRCGAEWRLVARSSLALAIEVDGFDGMLALRCWRCWLLCSGGLV